MALIACLSFLITPTIGGASEIKKNNKEEILQTAVYAMQINASAICVNGEILCVVKDNKTAQKVIDAFYADYAKYTANEALIDISWENKPETVNVKEDIFDIVSQDEAYKILKSSADYKKNLKTASAADVNNIAANTAPVVKSVKYVKEAKLINYNSTVEYSDTLYQNQDQIKQQGIEGVDENIYKIIYINDIEQERELVKSKQVVQPQDEIIIKGTKIRKQPEFALPTTGVVTSVYGPRNNEMHWGIDIANSKDTIITASKDGVVMRAEWFYGYGKCIDVVHDDGSWTRYGHLNDFLVKVNDKVKQGEKIALMGTTGRSTGYHLHFEIRYGKWPYGRTIDPKYALDLTQLEN